MKELAVKGIFESKIILKDLHSDPLDGANYYQKIMPSSTREKLIEYANSKGQSELQAIIEIVIMRMDGEI